MKQENKILVWAVFILLIAIVSFNFTGMTGEHVRNRISTMKLDKTYVLPSETITLTITPGIEGVDKDIDIYEDLGNPKLDRRRVQAAIHICKRYKCTDKTTVTYKLTDGFIPGEYYFRLYDIYSKEYVISKFKVGVKYQPAGPRVHY